MSFVTSPPESLCLIRLSAIGDCCHTLPVVRTLQAAWPDTPITWIVGKVERSLLEGAAGIEFITFDKAKGMAGLFDIRRQLNGRRFPMLLHMHASMRANAVSTIVSANRRIGFDRARARDYQWLFSSERIPARAQQHVMDGLFEFAEYLGVGDRVLRWEIPVAETDQQYAQDLRHDAGPLVVISPCSSQRFRNFRNWSVPNYIDIVRHLQQRHGAQIVLTGADTEIEREYTRSIAAGAGSGVLDLVGQTSLKRLLAIIANADLVLCPDSGPAHMAAAVGTPVVGLYATSNRHRTGPYFSQALVADRYPDAIAAEFDKPIESLRWGQRVRDPAAMDLITLADVTEKVDTVLAPGYVHAQQPMPLPVLAQT
jgi:heptosyltransferase I